ncbi:MAG: OadG family protein [Clostridia bacterium]|nr:OadG family protein [Clostridia bacterium]
MLLSADVSVLADAGSVIAIGLTVVFLVLLLLTGVFKIFGIAMSRDEDEEVIPAPAKVAPPVAAPRAAIVGNTETVSSKPDVDGGVPAETVAVISAAVASVAPEGTQYAVKGIRKV